MTGDLPVVWAPRAVPLDPAAAVALGEAAHALVARARGGPWVGLVGDGWAAVLGDAPPWVDGIAYLGRDPAAPRLLLPTHAEPTVAELAVTSLLDRWAWRTCAGHPAPYAIVPGFGVIPLGGARPFPARP